MTELTVLFLSQEDVIACGGLDMATAIAAVEDAYILYSSGDFVQPEKRVLRWGDYRTEETRGRIVAMPSFVGGKVQAAGIKWIGSAPENPKKHQLPRASALIILNDPESMVPLAIMDGTIISAMRTAAAAGVGAKFLAKRNSESIALIGAGVINRLVACAVREVIPSIQEIRVYDLVPDRSTKLRDTLKIELPVKALVAAHVQQAVVNADIVSLATVASDPYLEGAWLSPGCLVCSLSHADARESSIRRAEKIVVASEGALDTADGEALGAALDRGIIRREMLMLIGDVVRGTANGRESDDEIIFFRPNGMSVQDISLAARIYRNAQHMRKGVRLSLWREPLAL